MGRPNASRHRVHRSGGTNRSTRCGWDTCFTARCAPPCQGLWCAADCYLEHTRRASSPGTPEEDASHQSLQSTCCQGNSKDRLAHELRAFAPSIPATLVEPRARHACTERDTSRPRGRGLAVAGITCLEWQIGWTPISPAVTWHSPPLGDAWKPGIARAGVVNHCTSRDSKITGVSLHPSTRPWLPSAGSAS